MDLIIPFKGELHLSRTKFFCEELPDYSEMIFFVQSFHDQISFASEEC